MENAISADRNFYHSFPRRRPSDTQEFVLTRGQAILKAIKDIGLILAPEVVEWSIPQVDGSTKVIRSRQTRICFTELSRAELPGHARTFGPFSLEFPIQVLREYGILPVIYVPQMVPGDRLLSSFGPVIVWMFENARYTLDSLDQLARLSDPQSALEFARRTHPEATHVDPNYALHLQNSDEEKKVVKTFDVKASTVRGILDYLSYKTAPFELMRGAIYAAQNLFYPTDDQVNDRILSYYRQREWRIIPGATVEGKKITRMATSAEKDFLLNLDHRFWSREIADDRGSFLRIDEAQVIDEYRGEHISEQVKTIIVPPKAEDQARDIFGNRVETVDELTLDEQ